MNEKIQVFKELSDSLTIMGFRKKNIRSFPPNSFLSTLEAFSIGLFLKFGDGLPNKPLMVRLIFLLCFVFLTACTQYSSNLDALGSQNSFADVEIPDDFPAPEDEAPDDEDGQEIMPPMTPPPVQVSLKNTFFIEDRTFTLARGPAVRWDGCIQDKASRGGYNSDSQCGRAFFHPVFAENLNETFFSCVHEAAKEAGIPEPARIFVRHLGTYNDRTARNSSRLSNHAYARAWDIVNFNMYDAQGNRHRVSTYLRDYKDEQAVFYDEFRDCWMAALPDSCGPGNTEYKGSVGHTSSKLGGSSLHNDHLHLSYPLCAGNS